MLKALLVTAAVTLALPAYAHDMRTAQVDVGVGGARVHVPDPFRGDRDRRDLRDVRPRCAPGQVAVEVTDDRGRHFECTSVRDGYRDHR